MKKSLFLIIAALLFALIGESTAQNATIKASLDSTQMWIGQQNRIHIEVAANQNAKLNLLLKEKNIMPGIEILEVSELDTTDIGNNRILIKYDYLITSFDEYLYAIPPFQLEEQGDTILSNELALKVVTVPIDTTKLDHWFDIKDVITPPFVWKDYINYILYPLLGLVLVALIVIAYFIFIKKKPIVRIVKEEPLLPPHIVALNELDNIKGKKLWQSGKIKEYHSSITDTLRMYIERRFDINAMEMTSGEVLARIKGVSDVDAVYDKLKQVLLLGDLVKFAKYHALPDENELSLLNAYLFVNNTKIEELPLTPEKQIENKSNTNNQITD